MQGFYGVYEELFCRLAKQEQEAASEGAEKSRGLPEQPPLFGGPSLLIPSQPSADLGEMLKPCPAILPQLAE